MSRDHLEGTGRCPNVSGSRWTIKTKFEMITFKNTTVIPIIEYFTFGLQAVYHYIQTICMATQYK